MTERITTRRRRPGLRAPRFLLPIVAALGLLVLVPGPASAAVSAAPAGFTDRITGVEYGFTPTVGRFAGVATGPRSGLFDAVVPHTVLDPNAAITRGGSFVIRSSPSVAGSFTGGTIRLVSGGSGCRNEVYAVNGDLAVNGGGTGAFRMTLTHYQRPIAGACRTYFATVAGTVTIGPGGDPT